MKQDEIELISQYGHALIQMGENPDVYKNGSIKDAELKSYIHNLRTRAIDYYKNKRTRLGGYMMAREGGAKDPTLNEDALTIIAVMVAQYFYRDIEYTNMTWLGRVCYLVDDKDNKSIRFKMVVIRELILSATVYLRPVERYLDKSLPPAIRMGKNLRKDMLNHNEPLLSREAIIKERRIRYNKRKRDGWKK